MFLTYARRLRLDYILSDEQRTSMRRIRQLVNGMPLGIELAAAWAHSLSPIEIADELARDIDLSSFAQFVVVK